MRRLVVDAAIEQIEYEHRMDLTGEAVMWRAVLHQVIRDAARGDREAREYWWTPAYLHVCELACVDPGRVRTMMIRRGWGVRRESPTPGRATLTLRRTKNVQDAQEERTGREAGRQSTAEDPVPRSGSAGPDNDAG